MKMLHPTTHISGNNFVRF